MLRSILLNPFFLAPLVTVFLLTALITQPVLWPARGRSVPSVRQETLKGHVEMLAEKLHPRCYDSPDNLEAAARYIERYFAAAGGRVSRQQFSVDGLGYSNVIASFGPPGPTLVIGAHYDSYGENYQEPPLYTPGADDNASGVAGLLALADLLGAHPPAKQVTLVAYCLEEPPFFRTNQMGSAMHAALANEARTTIIGVISLEMLGYFSDAPGSQTYPADFMTLVYPDTGNFISVVGRFQDMLLTRAIKKAMLGASDLPVWSINAPALLPGVDFSDHRNYWPYGYEAVMITDTAFYRNAAYHTRNDKANCLDYERMAKVVQGVFAAAMELTETGQ